jgi:hypothetical protein
VRQLEFSISRDGKTLLDTVCALPISHETTLEDLNRDGIPEVFVVGGNLCLSGGDASSVWLFIRNEAGAYQTHLGFPAAAYEMLDSMNAGFPDLNLVAEASVAGCGVGTGKITST